MAEDHSPELRRSLRLVDVIAIGINGVVGQGIFLLPGLAAATLGPASLVGMVLGGLLCFLIALAFARVGSRFEGTGGAYLYTKEVFGDFVGFEVGWMTCIVAVVAWAALANGFALVLGHFVPAVATGWAARATAIGLMAGLTVVNLRGAKSGAAISTILSVAKLIPLLLFISVGLFYVEPSRFTPFAPAGYDKLADVTLLLLYAYVGFETLVVPAGEMENPQRSVPIAMLAVMSLVSVIYILVFVVAIGTLPELAGHANPVAVAATGFLGTAGGTLVAFGIVVSVFGTNAGAALVSPRRFYAMAMRGDLPRVFASVHPKTGSPTNAILLTFVLASLLTLTGNFKELAVLSVVARFVQYIPTILAALVLDRRSDDRKVGFRLPLGPVIPIAALILCGWLLTASDPSRLLKGGGALLVGVPLWWLARSRKTKQPMGDNP